MARHKIIITKYYFKKPALISGEEYTSYIQIFKADPSFDITPKSDFWEEFKFEKYILICIAGGGLLAIVIPAAGVIAMIGFVLLITGLMTGSAASMMNYQEMLNERRKYFNDLKKIIIKSSDYIEFCNKYKNIYYGDFEIFK